MNEIDEVMEQFIQFGLQIHSLPNAIGLWKMNNVLYYGQLLNVTNHTIGSR